MHRRADASGLYRELDFPHVGKPISTPEVEPVIYLYLSCARSEELLHSPHVNKSRVVFLRLSWGSRTLGHFRASQHSESRKRDSIIYLYFPQKK